MKKFADQATMIPTMPPVDLNQSVEQYFQFVQKTVDLNRDLATNWVELVNTLTGATREQAESFSRIVKDQADTLAGMAAQQAETTQQVAHERAEQAEQAKQERTRRARQAERERVNQDRAKAREAYEGLTKAELSDQLAARGLPRTGTLTTSSTDSSKRTTIDDRAPRPVPGSPGSGPVGANVHHAGLPAISMVLGMHRPRPSRRLGR